MEGWLEVVARGKPRRYWVDSMNRLILSSCMRWALGAIVVCASARSGAANSYALLPATTVLTGPHASQQLLIESVAKERFTGDKTAATKFASSDPAIATVDEKGVVHPVNDG